MEKTFPTDSKLFKVSQIDRDSYAREARENLKSISNFLVRQRLHVGAMYLAFKYLITDLENQFPEVKELVND